MTDDTLRSVVFEPDLDDVDGSGGAVWSLPHDGDLDANLVRLGAGARLDEHVNDEVDVLLAVRAGSGLLTVDGDAHELGPGALALIPTGRRRSITAGAGGLAYLSIHRRRGPLTIASPPGDGSATTG